MGRREVEEANNCLEEVYKRKNNETRPDQIEFFLYCAVVYKVMSQSNAGVVYLRTGRELRRHDFPA